MSRTSLHKLSHIDPDSRTAICSECGPTTIHVRRIQNDKTRWRCANRNRDRKKEREKEDEEYERLVAGRTNPTCDLCGSPKSHGEKRLFVDHCHRTGIVRGLLCGHCNTGLGMFKDDPELMREAATYIERRAGRS